MSRLPQLPKLPVAGLLSKVVAALVVVALAAGAYAFWPRNDKVQVTGEFTRAVGLFPGSDVRILGVEVGEVTEVTPMGEKVVVTFEYDRKYKVPATAQAVVMAPSLVSDRYVQLTPAYTGGEVMADGARIGLDRTAVPVELDRISQNLDDLLVALGPEGANKDGALTRLLDTSAANLNGQGKNIHELNRNLGLALQTLAGGQNDMFASVKNIQSFTTMLATNDAQVRRLNQDLASVSVQLDAERDDLAAALKNLAIALNEVSTFVHDNRAGLTKNIAQLTDVTTTVAKQRDALNETLTNAPVAYSNLQNAYNPKSGTLDTRSNVEQLQHPEQFLCGLLTPPGGQPPTDLCKGLATVITPLLDALHQLESGGGDLHSPVPGDAVGTSSAPPGTTVEIRGADPTLGGLLEVSQ